MTAPPSYVSVAGLRVPAELVPPIIAAMRGSYPQQTEGLDDDAAVRAVLKEWVTSCLATWESQRVVVEAEAEVEAIRAASAAEAKRAEEAAKEAAKGIVEMPEPVIEEQVP